MYVTRTEIVVKPVGIFTLQYKIIALSPVFARKWHGVRPIYTEIFLP